MRHIRSRTQVRSRYTVINKELSPEYKYLDLKDMLQTLVHNGRTAFKINISFGTMLYHVTDKEYKYK